MIPKVPLSELSARVERFRTRMDAAHPDWALCVVFSRINQYYFTGTMQDGMLFIPRDGAPELFVRRSYERALDESLFPAIRPMGSYRDAAAVTGAVPESVYLETEVVPLALLQRFRKYFPVNDVHSVDSEIAKTRSLKSMYEIRQMERAGAIHRSVLEEGIPGMLREGMTEAEFGAGVYLQMVKEGHHGIVRFGMFQTEIEVGQLGFGDSSIYPAAFDGPGGCRGIGPAAPVLGSQSRTLRRGDLVFIDNACGFEGYQTDKTMTYMFKESLPEEAVVAHMECVDIQGRMAAMLKPGITPSQIYTAIYESLPSGFLENFMGFGTRRASFLGHGTGLQVDEFPVIAKGSDDPLEEGMVLALEPKKGIKDIGMVGIENTFVVTPQGGRSITGHHPGLMLVE
ncbi:Xaa-Pro aminopeptidase [Methanolinea mesophila]|uniref:M24 family metallopeptidase n=1 Tax=Methanolinea mesophila TaxID=547055 RepID=UPI001AE2F3AD|nr:Xaa-Pro peptidase family protein [Methanolinea mesophila]MBP1928879.1 Xaa-Pro aminopeptidase [Methanolinea mesophila]